MKNYLGNLIARHLDQVEVIQPRLPSRFEPPSIVFQADILPPKTSEGDLTKNNFVEDPIVTATEIEHRVESPPVPISRFAQPASDKNSASPAIYNNPSTPSSRPQDSQPHERAPSANFDDEPTEPAALTNLVVATAQRDKTNASGSVSVFSSRTDAPPSETQSVPSVAPKPRLTENTDQSSKGEDNASRSPRGSSPASTTDKLNQPGVPVRSKQTIKADPTIDFQSVVRTRETGIGSTVPDRKSSAAVSSVPRPESNRSSDLPKPREVEAPAACDEPPRVSPPPVVSLSPEALRFTSVESVQTENPVSPNNPNRRSDEIQQPRKKQRPLETFVVRPLPDDPMRSEALSPDETRPADSGPTINVTIGRVEVRATTQTTEATPQKKPRDQQVFSLDEYLSQRAMGGR